MILTVRGGNYNNIIFKYVKGKKQRYRLISVKPLKEYVKLTYKKIK